MAGVMTDVVLNVRQTSLTRDIQVCGKTIRVTVTRRPGSYGVHWEAVREDSKPVGHGTIGDYGDEPLDHPELWEEIKDMVEWDLTRGGVYE